jgi:hypothetical protein
MPSWPHSDDNMLYHAPRRADQPLPCTTNTASYAHFPPIPYHDPSIKYAPARRPHESWQPNIRPDHARYPNSLRLPLCCLLPRQTNFSTGLWDDRRLSTFLRCIALMGLNFCLFSEAQSGFGWTAMRYTLHGPNNTLFPPILVSSACNVVVFMSLAGVTHVRPPPIPYHRDGMARVADVL